MSNPNAERGRPVETGHPRETLVFLGRLDDTETKASLRLVQALRFTRQFGLPFHTARAVADFHFGRAA